MIVLGFDTATLSTAVALRLGDGSTLAARDDPGTNEHPGHTRLLALAGGLLSQAGVAWGALDRIAVGVGPGRFTGLRVGVASARGLAQSLELELVGVSSLRTLALAAGRRGIEQDGVLAVIDARRGEAFLAGYRASALASAGALADGELVFSRALKPQELECAPELIAQRGGDGAARWLAVGDGAVCFRERLERGGVSVAEDSSPLHLMDPAATCELGLQGTPASSIEEVLPDYRRTPDAALAPERVIAPGGASA